MIEPTTNPAKTIDRDVESFLLLLGVQRSPRTVDAYRRDLGNLSTVRAGLVSEASVEDLEKDFGRG